MAVKASLSRTVDSTTAVRINEFASAGMEPGANAYGLQEGVTCLVTTSGALHWGGTSAVTSTGANRGALLAAGTYVITVKPGSTDDYWVIAPSGQSVTIEVLHSGVAP